MESEYRECQSRVCEERFSRDKERIQALEDRGDASASLLAAAVSTLERVTKQLDDHENRLREAEKRPVAFWDKLIGALIAAAVSAFVAYLMTGGGGV